LRCLRNSLLVGLFGVPMVAVHGQAFVIFNGTDNTCTGAFLDSGGQGATGYSNNEDYTYTICPDNPGDAISINFLTYQLSTAGAAPIDNLTIYDGNSTATPLIGTYTGTSLQGQVISASSGNSTGCLTFVWHSNNSGSGVFAGSITCFLPCARPVADATMSQPAPAMICPGETISFNGSGSTAAAGLSIANYTWVWDDGTTSSSASPNATHTFTTPGEYLVQLIVEDNNGCASVNLLNLQVLVGTVPTFTGTSSGPAGCAGSTVCLDGVVNATTWNAQPSANFGAGVFLPDQVGSCFTSSLLFDAFAPGATLNNINLLQTICLDIEHSFLGDLVISIISPSGETVMLQQQGSGNTFLGIPVDPDENNPIPGTCWTYCFSPTATNGTMTANAGGTLPAGTYESVDPLSGLLGSQLNGLWTIEICDLWGLDNGFLCGWAMDFDPSLFPDVTEFTPVHGNACDSTWWTGANVVSTSADCDQLCVQPSTPGTHSYVYHAVDNFGCAYDTTISITISAAPAANAGPDQVICAGQGPVPLSATASGGAAPVNCVYSLQMLDSFGDGWNGASVTVTINGAPTTYTLNTGYNGTVNLPVQTGDVIAVSFSSGIFDWEITYRIRNGSNTIQFNSGPNPASGPAWSGVVNCATLPITYTYAWSPSTGLSNANIANPTAIPGSTTTYMVTATQVGQPGCVGTDQVTVTVNTPNGAGTDGTVTMCSTAAQFDLYNYLGGATPGGTWTAPGGGAASSTFLPGTSTPGVYTYSVMSPAPCPGMDQSTVTVILVSPPDPGNNGTLTLCSSSPASSLFAHLGGVPQAGGTWSGPSSVSGGMFDPTTMIPGVYTYSLPGVAPCPPASSSVTVIVTAPPNAGSGGTLTICGDAGPASLFAQLGGAPSPGGTWSGPSVVVGGQFDPSSMLSGNYTYTVAGAVPCPDATATVSVLVAPPPDAGTNGGLTVCSTAPASSLFAQLGGTPDAGGTWSGPSTVVAGMFDPGTMNAGIYTYTVAGSAPCASSTATVSVSLSSLPNAGSPSSSTLCAGGPSILLFGLLGGAPDAGGGWSGPSPVNAGLFDPATMAAGIYTYTVGGNPPCPSSSATVTMNVTQPVDAGTGDAITLCSTDAAVSLFAQLGGSPDAGGTWSGPSAVVGGVFDPASMSAGVYTYTINGTTPCPSESSTVTVTINTPPDTGTNGSITLCPTDAPASLFAQLGGTPDAGGTWSGPSAVVGGVFDPASMTAGVYTYTITVPPPCTSASSTVTVTLSAAPDAGNDGVLTLCISSLATDLFASLGGTPEVGGSWSAPDGTAFSGSFDPTTDAPGIYTYTVNGTSPCLPTSSSVNVSVITLPDPGLPGVLTLCTTDAATALFAQLGGTPDGGGTWTDPGGMAFSGTFDPAVDQVGIYSYTISSPLPCVSVTSTVTIALNPPPDAGLNGTLNLCATSGASALFNALGGIPNVGGTWTDPFGNAHGGTFDPAVDAPGIYTYTVAGLLPCPSASASATVTVTPQMNAGQPSILNLCITGAPVDLFPALGPADPSGTWTGPYGVSFAGIFTPGTDPAGAYTYTVAGTPQCPSGSAAVTVNVLSNPDAGLDGALTLCSTNASVDLFTALGGTPDPGGLWIDPLGQPMTTLFDPDSSTTGLYTYLVLVTQPCINDTAQVNVAVVIAPEAGMNGTWTLCVNDPPVTLIGLLGGTPDAGGSWTAPNNQPFTGSFDAALDAPGNYTYIVAGTSPCPNDVAAVTMTVDPMPDAGIDGSTTVCPEAAPVTLFALLGGAPDAGGQWTDPNGAACTGVFDPSSSPQGVYTYTVISQGACPNVSATATVSVYVIAVPDAGPDMVVCDQSVMLNATGVWSSGQWSAPSTVIVFNIDSAATLATSSIGGAATFVWSTISADGCGAMDSVTITFTEPIIPALVAEDAVCSGYCDGTAEVTTIGGNGAYNYQWTPAIAGNNASLATGLCAGTYAVTVLDTNGCSMQSTFLIAEPPPLDIDNIVSTPETCPGACDGSVTVVDAQGVLFSFDGGITFQQATTLSPLCAGPFNVVVMDINGCLAMAPTAVLSPAPVIAEFVAQPDTVLVSDPSIQFTNESENASWFTWDFAGLGSSTFHDPGFTFPDLLGGTYIVCLTATNANGCVDSVCHPVVVLDLLSVHVPNTFTPNGDGINEGFMPIFNEPQLLTEYEFLIFDRWGELLWESHTPHQPWDGWYRGQLVKDDVYVWKLTYKDGRSYKKEAVIGHVTVLK
jgi:gliding motility-associated-like protein